MRVIKLITIKSVELFRGRSHKNQINKIVNWHVFIVSTGCITLYSKIKIKWGKIKGKEGEKLVLPVFPG